MKDPSITLFMPVRNELAGLKLLFDRIPRHLFVQILLVDKSDDTSTIEWAKEKKVDIIAQKSRGLRNAYTEGWPHIKGDFVITFSPDGNCIPEDLPLLIDKLRSGYDMVIATRYGEGSRSDDDSLITAFGNWMFTKLINLCFGGQYSDVMTIYRGYRAKLFYDLDIHLDSSHWEERLFHTVVGIEPLLSIRAAKRRIKSTSVPSVEPKRIAGVPKLQIFRWGGAHLVQIVYEIFFWR